MDVAYSQISAGRVGKTDASTAIAGTVGKIAYFGALAAVLIAAVPFGTVEPWHKGVLVAAVSVFGTFRIIDGILRKNFRLAEPLLLVPMVGVLLLAGVQLAPMPFGESPISRDPYQTSVFMLVFGALLVFAEVLFTYTRAARRLRYLIGVVLAVAIGSSVFGFLRHLVAGSELDVFEGLIRANQSYAQFINRNHFALLVEMGLGLLIGILLKAELSEKARFAGWVGSGFLIYSMIASSSRGSLISLAAMAVFAVFLHVMTGSGSSDRHPLSEPSGRGPNRVRKLAAALGLCVIVLGMVLILVAFVGGDAVATRIEKLDSEIGSANSPSGTRASIWASTIEMIRERPIAGSGFGAYKTAFTGFDNFSNGKYAIEQAHNDYLEIAANGGVIGAALFGIFGALVGVRMARNLSTDDRFRRACCFGSMIAIFAVLVHSFVDFGLHIPVNAMIFIVLIVIGTASVESGAKSVFRNLAGR